MRPTCISPLASRGSTWPDSYIWIVELGLWVQVLQAAGPQVGELVHRRRPGER